MMMRPALRSEATALDLVVCPECDAVAEVEWRVVADSTEGPVEHVKIRCRHGHWFLMPLRRG